MSLLLHLLMRRIRWDPRRKDRDLRSARYTGEIPRDNSEPRLVSSLSARVEKDGQNQGRFLMQGNRSLLRDSVPATITLCNKGEKDTYDITCEPGRAQPSSNLSTRLAGKATINNHEQTDRKKEEESNGRPRPTRGLFLGNVVLSTIGRRIK
ncbi:hypothetical protein ALC62_15858 [Cyphomyrmex costatus]|uniref:Uncharacterized protein n=1 Tax=Cyphomyrmex costatus TaxID=456900 RepID=A0A195BYU8_9HYME|nr:hypothetical protein ALC62_15858 [Cyphomyrmex costatus]